MTFKERLRALTEVGLVSLKLGLTSFGGPIAHLGYFHNEYIRRRKWLDEQSYSDLMALCQFLPGPASSQVGIGIGIIRAGWLGGLMAWIGFTLPSVVALTLFALLLQGFDVSSSGWIHGLKITAVAIVAQAVLGMGQKLASDKIRATIAILAAAVSLLWQTAVSQIALLAAAGLAGYWLYRKAAVHAAPPLAVPISRRWGAACLALFAALLLALPLLRAFFDANGDSGLWLPMFDSFYRAGSLVFGGGHVVLPLLERETVPAGWIGEQQFLTGYGAAQAVPGPLFTFAAYLGAMAGGIPGAVIATLAIFLPAFLLVAGALPFWSSLRNSPSAQGGLAGVNAAVVGILLAALYNPLWTTAIMEPADLALALVLFLMLVFWKMPPWAVVLAGMLGGTLLALV
ncbi:chromate efflux transporter [Paenibacillus sp. NEAU-GSW1]|uniref:chromate efflux transporter n=1 Tax=Paenibacillus sp. NEAU-GSW1 TaxID=2682486 RepID=UPI0012E17913|nr:chromate efflux transporter [Paenibacillus sp. NEAU-GSW1]MUT66550.1 chromate efflux transporter [Paenibacillus sp. NEAU-GSW1]